MGTPIQLPTLADGSPAARAAAWLEEQLAGLQSLVDLARLLETTGGNATYDGTGSFADAANRIGPEIARVLASLDPEDQQDLAALTGIAGLLQRYSGDPVVENALIEEVGGTGLLDAFTSLVPVGAGAGRDARGDPRLVARPQPGTAARGDPGAEPHLRQHRRHPRAGPRPRQPQEPAGVPRGAPRHAREPGCLRAGRGAQHHRHVPGSTVPTSRSARSCGPSTRSRP